MDIKQYLNTLSNDVSSLCDDIKSSHTELTLIAKSLKVNATRFDKLVNGKLFVTEGGHLTAAGRATIAEGIRQGMTHFEIAEVLGISRGAVSQNAKRLGL